jgi:hypothetical protein
VYNRSDSLMTAATKPSLKAAKCFSYDHWSGGRPPVMRSTSSCSLICSLGRHARARRANCMPWAFDSWPAKAKMNMFPLTSSGFKSGASDSVFDSPAPTRKSSRLLLVSARSAFPLFSLRSCVSFRYLDSSLNIL